MIIPDMDGSGSPTHGHRKESARNGPFGRTGYHSLFFLFNQFGDLERRSLRPGNAHSADGWRDVPGRRSLSATGNRSCPLLPRGCHIRLSGPLRIFGSRGLQVRHPPQSQRRSPGMHRHLLRRPVGRSLNHVRRSHTTSVRLQLHALALQPWPFPTHPGAVKGARLSPPNDHLGKMDVGTRAKWEISGNLLNFKNLRKLCGGLI